MLAASTAGHPWPWLWLGCAAASSVQVLEPTEPTARPRPPPAKGLPHPKPSTHGQGRWSCYAACTEQIELWPSPSPARRDQRKHLLCVFTSVQATEPPALCASAEMATTTGHQCRASNNGNLFPGCLEARSLRAKHRGCAPSVALGAISVPRGGHTDPAPC